MKDFEKLREYDYVPTKTKQEFIAILTLFGANM